MVGFDDYSPTLPKAAKHTEAEVKAQIRTALRDDFTMREEVVGKGWDGTKVKVDFWCRPNERTLARGWPDGWLGIEAKGWGLQDQRKKTCARLLYQSILYRLGQFPTDTEAACPNIVLVCPPFLTILREDPVAEDAYIDDVFLNGYAFALAKTAGMFRIGELQLTAGGYAVYFHGINRWWDNQIGRVGTDCLGAEDRHASR